MPQSNKTETSPATVKKLAFPTADDYREAEKALSYAYDLVESVSYPLCQLAKADPSPGDCVRPPTAADVGLAFSFVDALEMEVEQLRDEAFTMRKGLSVLNFVRLRAEDDA